MAIKVTISRQCTDARGFWPLATGFVPAQSLTVTDVWTPVAFPYMTNATDISITVPLPNGNKFYRLRKP